MGVVQRGRKGALSGARSRVLAGALGAVALLEPAARGSARIAIGLACAADGCVLESAHAVGAAARALLAVGSIAAGRSAGVGVLHTVAAHGIELLSADAPRAAGGGLGGGIGAGAAVGRGEATAASHALVGVAVRLGALACRARVLAADGAILLGAGAARRLADGLAAVLAAPNAAALPAPASVVGGVGVHGGQGGQPAECWVCRRKEQEGEQDSVTRAGEEGTLGASWSASDTRWRGGGLGAKSSLCTGAVVAALLSPARASAVTGAHPSSRRSSGGATWLRRRLGRPTSLEAGLGGRQRWMRVREEETASARFGRCVIRRVALAASGAAGGLSGSYTRCPSRLHQHCSCVQRAKEKREGHSASLQPPAACPSPRLSAWRSFKSGWTRNSVQ